MPGSGSAHLLTPFEALSSVRFSFRMSRSASRVYKPFSFQCSPFESSVGAFSLLIRVGVAREQSVPPCHSPPPPLFSPRLGRFFRFFNESLHESCNRIKDILSSRSVCLMPSIESIGAISSLGGRAIDSSCPWLVKGMSSRTIESLKLRNYRISQELNKLFYASGIGKHDKSVLHILASSLVFKERKLQRLTEEKGKIILSGLN
ncbi:hypothetical protein L6452_35495 [Arctium lappa]|uniref:Uncharacterized protein n=1 Tax=Arctium lappa TaxID=4217 RepID=A0ACB8Y7A1_ARCLA|nr:hypothetical protein L6452_35495 [Arctium lappa]